MQPTSPYFRNFPKGFREHEVKAILMAAKNGRNVQLIGLKGSGKSQIFRYIMGNVEISNDFDVAEIDFNLIPERTPSAVCKLMLENLKEWESAPSAFSKKTIILADSFENVANIMDESVVHVFESIISRHREFISFVFSVDRPIESGNVYWGEHLFISPLTKADFEWFYKGLSGDARHKEDIYKAAGGHVGLVKRLTEAVNSGKDLDEIIKNPRVNPHILYHLELMKEGLRGKPNYFDVPLYNTFLNGVKINGELTSLENKAFQCLIKQKGVIVEREALIAAVWGDRATRGIADHALDQVMHRLKVKIAKDGYKIETLRGRGHRLV